MRIGICDDFPELRKMLREKIEEGNYVRDYEIEEFGSASEIIQKKPQLDLLFLDVGMPGMTGLELLEAYPQLFYNMKVALVTSYTDYMAEAFELNVFRYLIKPAQEDDLQELFEAMQEKGMLDETLTVKVDGVDSELALKHIMYIEKEKEHSIIVTGRERLHCDSNLDELETHLPKQYFNRTHKSYIINMRCLKCFDTETRITMINGENVRLSFWNRKKFREEYTTYKVNRRKY